MNDLLEAGFGTLAQLKGRILPAIMEDYDGDDEWDQDFRDIGLAVAGEFNRYCNRIFQRGEDAKWDGEGGASSVVVDRYPVEAVTQLQLITGSGTDDRTDGIYSYKPSSGVIEFNGCIGTHRDRVTVTYTGGYWLGSATTIGLGTEAKNFFAPVPVDSTVATVVADAFPDGFDADDVSQVSLKKGAGVQASMHVVDWSVNAGVLEVQLSSQAVNVDDFELSILLMKEPEASGNGDAMPAEATALPREIYNAWVMQCQAAVTHMNTLYTAGVDKSGDVVSLLAELEMLPAVKAILNPYKRFI